MILKLTLEVFTEYVLFIQETIKIVIPNHEVMYPLLRRSLKSEWFYYALVRSRRHLSHVRDGMVISRHSQLIDKAKQKGNHLKFKEQFANALRDYVAKEKFRRGHVSFIAVALHRMDEFSLEKDLETYNMLLNVFPKKKFHNRNIFDALWPKPLPQVELALNLLQKMEDNGIRPEVTTYDILVEIFGRVSLPVTKCLRIAYWFDRYEDIDPYEIKVGLPTDPVELSKIALQRIAGTNGILDRIQV